MAEDRLTLDHLLDRPGSQTDTDPGAVALVDGVRRRAWSELRTDKASLARGLKALGVDRGDVVTWQLPNWHETVVLFHACWRIGAVAAPIHHRHGEQEVSIQLAALRPRALLAAPSLPASAWSVPRRPEVLQVRGDGGYENLLAEQADPMRLRGPAAEGAGASLSHPDDRAVVLFTSGSADRPKGVVHTHRSLGYKARTMASVHGLAPADVVLMPAPLAHVSGLLNGVLLPSAAGMKVVLMERWDPSQALQLIAAEGVSFMVGPPTYFLALMEHPALSPQMVASLRLVSCGGAGVTSAFAEQASARLGARVKRSYGSTEAPTVATWHDGDPVDRAVTSDGRAVGHVELAIVAPGTGEPLPPGQTGELWVRGPEVAAGYLVSGPALRQDAPAEGFTDDGWFRTGDLAVLDQEGWLTVVGRRRDLIVRGGENIAPAEVEAALEAHPAVRRAVAVGLPDDHLGEVVGAVVVTADRSRPVSHAGAGSPAETGGFDLTACRAWFVERGVASFKVPAHVLGVSEIPLLGSGKPDRGAVKQLLMTAVAAS